MNTVRRTVGIVLALWSTVALSVVTAAGGPLPARPGVPPPGAEPGGRVALPGGASQDWWSQAQIQIAAEEYAVAAAGADSPGTYRAFNRAQGFSTAFNGKGIRLEPVRKKEKAASWDWGLELVGWGRPGVLLPAPKATASVQGSRVEYMRGSLTEWYFNDEQGLEHGFTIPAPPPDSVLSPQSSALSPRSSALSTQSLLHIDLALTGTLHPKFSKDGQAVDFYDGGNVAVLRYAQLKVTDATGHVLPSRFEGWAGSLPSTLNPPLSTATTGGIRISIDDSNAVYPITVDPLATSPSWTATGEAASNNLGYSAATAGDVNGDGYSDVVVGAYGYSSDTGKAYLYLGGPSGLSSAASWTAVGQATGDQYGTSVATAGDVNGDGYADVLVGAPQNNSGMGKAYLYLGGPSGLSTTASWTAIGENIPFYFGYRVATAGDVNGDGYSDVVVGAFGHISETGKAFLYLGRPSGLSATPSWTKVGEATGARFGISVATAGDVNGDGYSDVVVGADSLNEGAAYLYIGGPSGLSVTASWGVAGVTLGSLMGHSVSTAGDVNGDGYSDVIIGAPYNNTYRGYACLYLGGPSGPIATPSWTAFGEADYDEFGLSVAAAGDVNGDGYSDVLVGADGYGSYAGKAYLYLGGPSGLSPTASWGAQGEAAGNRLGVSVATAGDVNGDGFSDVIVGSPWVSSNAGKAYLYLGGSSWLSALSNWSVLGEGASHNLGYSLAGAGDVNGDGYSDVVVGARQFGGDLGKAYLYLGGPAGLSTTAAWTAVGEASGSNFGLSTASAGDVNGDGYSDVLIGSFGLTSQAGKAYLYLGGPTGLPLTASWSAVGEGIGDCFGYSVARAGDVNGDGYSDVVIGAYGYAGYSGRAYLYLGSPSGISASTWTTTGNYADDRLGFSVTTAGDVNGDGYSDVIVGAVGAGGTGQVYLHLGGPSGLGAWTWYAAGEASNDAFGYCVATAGDVNGDGYSDVIVGAPDYSNLFASRGKAYLYLGSPSGLSASTWATTGNAVNGRLGFSVATAGDTNGDGYSDVIVGEYGYFQGSNQGQVYLHLGGPSGLNPWTWSAIGEAANNAFGYCVAGAGDVNGDGYSDVIVGAPGAGGFSVGKAYLFYGNGGAGVAVLARQKQGNGSKDIVAGCASADDEFLVSLLPHSPFGRGKAQIEWQVSPLQTVLAGAPGDYQRGLGWWTTGSSTPVTGLATGLPAGVWHWRVRLRYRASTTPWLPASRWFHVSGAALQEGHLRVFGPQGCVPPDEPCWLYSVIKSGTDYTLNFQDPNQANQRTGWNIRRSNNPALLPKSAWPLVGSNVVDMDAGAANYQWTDHSGADPTPSLVWYYEVTTYNANCPAEGPF